MLGISLMVPVQECSGTGGGIRVVISNSSQTEGTAIGTAIGTVSVVGGTGVYTFSKTADPDSAFTLTGSTLKNAIVFNYEAQSSYSVTIQADGGTPTTVANPIAISVIDVAAPVLSNATSLETGSTTATLTWDTTVGNGTLYVIGSADNVAPSAAQIIAGHDHTGSAAAYAHNQAVSGTGTQTVNATGLSASTTYYPFAVQVGLPSENSNVSAAASFTTEASAGMAGTTFWLAQGDSRTVGAGTSPNTNYVTLANNSGNIPWVPRRANVAVNGYTLTDVIAQASTVDAYITNNPGFANYVLSILIGVNSLILSGGDYSGNTAGFITNLAAYCDARRSAGWQVVLCTELPAYTGADATYYLAARATLNTAIHTWVGAHINAICDLAADPNIGQDGDQTNATYYQDNLHPTNAGHAIMATIMEAAILTVGSNADSDAVQSVLDTWSGSLKHANVTLSAANRSAANSAPGAFYGVMSTRSHVTGKRYFELQLAGGDNVVCGLDERYFINGAIDPDASPAWTSATSVARLSPYDIFPTQNNDQAIAVSWVGTFVIGKTASVTLLNAAPNAGSGTDIYTYAVDFDAGEVRIALNAAPLLSDPVNYTFRPHTRWAIASSSLDASTNTLPGTLNYTPPAGYSPF